jgi:hypothetical protein
MRPNPNPYPGVGARESARARAPGEATALARADRPGAAPLLALGRAAGGRRAGVRDELHEQLLGPPPRFVLISTAGAPARAPRPAPAARGGVRRAPCAQLCGRASVRANHRVSVRRG